MARDKLRGEVAPMADVAGSSAEVSTVDSGDTSQDSLRRRILRLANYQRGFQFKLQRIRPRSSFKDDDDEYEVATTEIQTCVKASFAAPQFAVLALYMLLAVHATLLYEYLGAPLAYLAFFTALARSIDVFTDPIMSWISDATRWRWGRRLPYMVGGCLFYGTAIILLLGVGVIRPTDDTATCALNGTDTDGSNLYTLVGGNNEDDKTLYAYWYGATFVFFYLCDTVCNVPYNALGPELSDSSEARQGLYFAQSILGFLGTLIGAITPPLLETAGLSKEWAFFVTGAFFAVYYVSAVGNLAANVAERVEGFQGQAAVPLVPSVLRSFGNAPFRVLLASWFIDSIGWYSLASILPFYVKYYLQPSKAGIEFMTDEIFLGFALGALFISAIIGTPFWGFVARRFGRYRAWLAYNLFNGLSNGLYIIVQPQDWKTAIVVTVFNGIPFGGKFLSDANLADTIDYDELSSGAGERREAQFTVFSSLVPKLVAIPAQALPLAIISALGFIESSTGCDADGETTTLAAEQNETVKFAIQLIFAFFPTFTNIVSFVVKLRYPITTSKDLALISAGISLHQRGIAAEDPLTGMLLMSPKDLTEEDKALGVSFDHFYASEQRKIYLNDGNVGAILWGLGGQLGMIGVCVACSLYGVISTFSLLDDTALSWAPCFLQVVFGMTLMLFAFTLMRFREALRVRHTPFKKHFMRRWIKKSQGRLFDDDEDGGAQNPLLSNPQLVLQRLRADSGLSDDEEEGGGAQAIEARRAAFQRNKSYYPPTGYVGSTRNLVQHNEEERERFIRRILSDKSLDNDEA
ncbi:Sodium-dependent lysophosphatidylcholine symporter 1-B [Hondaea fermentalgiana]|uniref:Sodium-dependent lysophosphatidylcholine symporter 1-B n=1 Tax=Hondaea fermentalgiana TaxID=2315210 RepID=A0A2R5GYH8_9STRA|nr:Sodium-dependent lysophosphatidylcholine symporter 1-B [Hondaea fermentalgiana]|eukprot:GBG33783.1 Sodium-dependent lysophosphatidylcholine symporter 1-B [Hondaea fermentalgiana]